MSDLDAVFKAMRSHVWMAPEAIAGQCGRDVRQVRSALSSLYRGQVVERRKALHDGRVGITGPANA